MRVLVARAGQLAGVFGPICDDPDCDCTDGGFILETGYPTAEVVVAERADVTHEHLLVACKDFLDGWGSWLDPDNEIATDMAERVEHVAADFGLGTRLRPRYDPTVEGWTFAVAG